MSNVSNLLPAEKTLALVDDLRETVRDFAAREQKALREYSVQTARARQRGDLDAGQLRAQVAGQIQISALSVASAKATATARAHARAERITKALRASKRFHHEATADREGRRKHKIQTETLNANRHREQSLAAANTRAAEFNAALANEDAALTQLAADARRAFSGYPALARRLAESPAPPAAEAASDEAQLLADLQQRLATTRAELDSFREKLLPRLFKLAWLWVFLTLCLLPLVTLLKSLGIHAVTYVHATIAVGVIAVLGFILHRVGHNVSHPPAIALGTALAAARQTHDLCRQQAAARQAQELEQVEAEFRIRNEQIDRDWTATAEEADAARAAWPVKLEQKAARIAATNDRILQRKLAHLDQNHADTAARLHAEAEAHFKSVADAAAALELEITTDNQTRWRELETAWQPRIQALYAAIAAAQTSAATLFPPWPAGWVETWKAPADFGNAAQFGQLQIDLPTLAETVPQDPRLSLPGPARFTLPLLLTYPERGSVLLETASTGRDEMIAALNNIILRLLATAPPGRLSFTIIDPVGLGQSFSGIMHLADYADHLINNRIWTQSAQIDERLATLNGHMEKVIQMYLRNEYATIAEYNEQAGNIAEKYHFLVVADFPTGFTETAAKRLLSIASSGARCGVFTLIHWDRRQPAPQDFSPDDLRKGSVCLAHRGSEIALAGRTQPGVGVVLEPPPAPDIAVGFIHKVGLSNRDSNRVEVPFSHIAPPDTALWSVETTTELRVPIGRTGATKLQYLAIGKGTRQHALLAGKTGSGKSTLFHTIITNLALWCSPEQVEFYLIDFKKGVEFKTYATHRLPHARVIAIESDREFGLSVLQKLDDELRRRGDLFRKTGCQDIAGYKRAGGREPIPRSLLIVDEFQELFVEDDKISQTASMLLDRIVRQGRAFGIHVLLGSQTLGGAYTVARTTLGQMVIRIALQCNEADAYLIMDDNNPAPRLLSRPGEGIYNDTAGSVEGNSPFQAVWLPDEVRDTYLDKVKGQVAKAGVTYPGPIVFEGNAPSDIRENPLLRALLSAETLTRAATPRIWLGAPNSIKGPTEATFLRQSGNNLLLVGQRDEAVLAILSASLLALAAQFPAGGLRLIVCDGSAPGSSPREFLDRVIQLIPHAVTSAKQSDLPQIMKGLTDDMASRTGDEPPGTTPTTFVLIHGLQKFNKLRHEDDYSFGSGDADAPPNPAVLLNTLLTEGTRHGFHVIATCDSYNNASRFLSRKALGEFELRVLFQMSANDSASLIDNPKASTLGLHRALFYNEQEGQLETFRPYSLPDTEWLEQTGRELRRLVG
ncbi:hypothetical protein LBMAG56_44350 [Verrucomicrobiota bacterium]|nr:hypothetical protein LBMAG56_44350 [Verrucomicrobiota bacterium]